MRSFQRNFSLLCRPLNNWHRYHKQLTKIVDNNVDAEEPLPDKTEPGLPFQDYYDHYYDPGSSYNSHDLRRDQLQTRPSFSGESGLFDEIISGTGTSAVAPPLGNPFGTDIPWDTALSEHPKEAQAVPSWSGDTWNEKKPRPASEARATRFASVPMYQDWNGAEGSTTTRQLFDVKPAREQHGNWESGPKKEPHTPLSVVGIKLNKARESNWGPSTKNGIKDQKVRSSDGVRPLVLVTPKPKNSFNISSSGRVWRTPQKNLQKKTTSWDPDSMRMKPAEDLKDRERQRALITGTPLTTTKQPRLRILRWSPDFPHTSFPRTRPYAVRTANFGKDLTPKEFPPADF